MAPCAPARRSRCRPRVEAVCPFSSYPVHVVLPAEVLAHDLFQDPPRLERTAPAPAPLITSAELLEFSAELDRQAAVRDFFTLDFEEPAR